MRFHHFDGEISAASVDHGYAERVRQEQPKSSALDVQVGGNHYKDMAIQPVDYIYRNGLGFLEGNVIKYVTRYKAKGGVEDLHKARHYIDLLIGYVSK